MTARKMAVMRSLLAVLLMVSLAFSGVAATDVVSNDEILNVQDCLLAGQVPYSVPVDANWTQLTTPFNLRLNFTPTGVATPQNANQVATCVLCAAQFDTQVQPKSGGHSYASYSLGGAWGVLVVDLGYLNEISVGYNDTVSIGAGCRIGNVAEVLANSGLGLPMGLAPAIGVGGHFTHGGWGLSSRTWGLTVDAIYAMDVVVANGSLIHVTNETDPHMFYALRGAADSFGIVTQFYLQAFQAPQTITNFIYSVPAAFESNQTATDSFLKFQDLVLQEDSPIDDSWNMLIFTDGTLYYLEGWCMNCTHDVYNTTMDTVLEIFNGGEAVSVKNLNYIDSVKNMAQPSGASLTVLPFDDTLHDTFYCKSVITRNDKPLTEASLLSYWTYVLEQGADAPSPWAIDVQLWGGSGSQVQVTQNGDNAFSAHDALFVFQHYAYTETHYPPWNDNITEFVDGLNEALTQPQIGTCNFGAYINFVDPELSPDEAHELYFGANTLGQLEEIKYKTDPNFTFWNPQAIGTHDAPYVGTDATNITTDGSCGGSIGFNCGGSAWGSCCSEYGFCGSTSDYCGPGCLGEFGTCSPPVSITSMSAASTSTPIYGFSDTTIAINSKRAVQNSAPASSSTETPGIASCTIGVTLTETTTVVSYTTVFIQSPSAQSSTELSTSTSTEDLTTTSTLTKTLYSTVHVKHTIVETSSTSSSSTESSSSVTPVSSSSSSGNEHVVVEVVTESPVVNIVTVVVRPTPA